MIFGKMNDFPLKILKLKKKKRRKRVKKGFAKGKKWKSEENC